MGTVFYYALAIALFFVTVHCLNRFVYEPKRRREAEAAPRITRVEVQKFWNEIEENTLPIAKATVHPRSLLSPQESRIGGAPLAIGDDTYWPVAKFDGQPLCLVVQLNFAELPPLEEFPEKGILQVFSSLDEIDEFGGSERVIRWDPTPDTDAVLEVPAELQKSNSKTRDFSETALSTGLPLMFKSETAQGNPENWPFEANSPIYDNRLPEDEETAAILDSWDDRADKIIQGYGDHWVGGHPRFVQGDFRGGHPDGKYLDRVLFHLGCDEDINIGDSGEVNVMISQDALKKRDFQKAYLTWDCC